MNGRHARGCGISSQDRNSTTVKKAANSIVGKVTWLYPARGRGSGARAGL
jgi:hypothetical protein